MMPISFGRGFGPEKSRRARWSEPRHPPTRVSQRLLRLERLEDRTAPAVVTPFTPRFSANATGDIAIIANTLETATTVGNPGRTRQDVIDAQNGVGPNLFRASG
jgi:hypothetical protein